MIVLPPFEKSYDGRRVLSTPELRLRRGEICAVLGANGSGKSTLARVVSGLVPSDLPHAPLSFSVGFMPQRSFGFNLSVTRNLLLAGGTAERAAALLEQLGISRLSAKNAGGLSGGETARVALARCLMQKSDLLVLDEPTSSMDMQGSLLAERLIVSYVSEYGCAVLLITHSLSQARRIAGRSIFLSSGRLIEDGPTETLLTSPREELTREFLEFSRI